MKETGLLLFQGRETLTFEDRRNSNLKEYTKVMGKKWDLRESIYGGDTDG